jgi:hypothetical protein
MEWTECSETLAYEIQTLGNYPEESIQHSEHGKSLKSGRGTMFLRIRRFHPLSSLQSALPHTVSPRHDDDDDDDDDDGLLVVILRSL